MATTTFSEEFNRLIRAVNDSLERENELQRQLRRTKDSLVSVALRLQVAIKVAEEDENTIGQLLNETAVLRTNTIASNRQANEAAELISNLNLTILQLKRKLKTAEETKAAAAPKPNELADEEVDAMFDDGDHMEYSIPAGTGGDLQSAAPFERWKMQQFLYTADTPGASINHDQHVVNMLAHAASADIRQSQSNVIEKRTIMSTAKRQNKKSLVNRSLPALDSNFFPGIDKPKWGDRQNFDDSDLGRYNMWTKNSPTKKELKSIRLHDR